MTLHSCRNGIVIPFLLEWNGSFHSCRNGVTPFESSQNGMTTPLLQEWSVIPFCLEENYHFIPFLVEWSNGFIPTGDFYICLMKGHSTLTICNPFPAYLPFLSTAKTHSPIRLFFILLYIHHYHCEFLYV